MEKIVDSKEMIMPVANANKFIIALNLNASTIQDELFINDLRRFIPRLAPFQIEIELTEDVFLVMDHKIIATLNSLKNAGAGIALDDFGTGFSNVSYLQELNVDTLKIDKRFISPLPGDNKALEIVRALISMAHAFSILVVAEGAETREQVELLKAEGCDIIQGFYFSKPLSVKDFVEYVSRGPESV
ncbi:MAG: EAL domain-containing protein [Spirochaetaceae bacterium]|nr:MAG: EAL domain-containing protein [Spirochaetaceae bacterium]